MSVITDASVTAYLATFDIPLNISIMTMTQSWQFLQQLNYNAQLTYMAKDFHGLTDFNVQMDQYSSTQPMLTTAWNTIKQIATSNLNVQKEMFVDPTMGQVGDLFASLAGFGLVFSVSSTDSSSTISSQVG